MMKKTTLMLLLALAGTAGLASDIHVAAAKGDFEKVKRIVEADPQALNEIYPANGTTPLIIAARSNKAMVEFLLSKKAEVNLKDKSGTTALHSAALRGKKDILELLLKHGAEVNARSNDGRTAAHYVLWRAGNPYKEMLELLAAHKADFGLKDDMGLTVLDLAKKTKNAAAIDFLTPKSGGNGKGP